MTSSSFIALRLVWGLPRRASHSLGVIHAKEKSSYYVPSRMTTPSFVVTLERFLQRVSAIPRHRAILSLQQHSMSLFGISISQCHAELVSASPLLTTRSQDKNRMTKDEILRSLHSLKNDKEKTKMGLPRTSAKPSQ